MDAALPRLAAALGEGRPAVLVAPPGAGKTTRVPLALLDAPWLSGTIVMLEPRRLAARAAARYMAATLGEDVGETVGYRVRFDSRASARTRILVVTEGVLTRRLQEDPALDGVGLVVFDEFHERSLDGDLALALTLDARQALRPDLRVLVMSATLDAENLADRLGGASRIEAPGRQYPVETRHLPRGRNTRLADDMAAAVRRALGETTGSVLGFLPGEADIRRTATALAAGALPDDVEVAPLYGALPAAAQDRAIAPAPPGMRKVVLATTIAETSLTIEGIAVVVDGGYKRVPRFDPSTGMTRLDTVRVSAAAAEQRRGRAGRLGPGICYRLWTPAEERALARHDTPEILQADLAPLALELASWGVRDPGALVWIDPPPEAAFGQARALLIALGALDEAGGITKMGKAMAALPLHPRLAHMIEAAPDAAARGLACDLAALLSERDVLEGARDADLRTRLDGVFAGGGEGGRTGIRIGYGARERVREAARQLRRIARAQARGEARDPGPLVALAYPDRVAQRRGGDRRYRFSGGGGGALDEGEALAVEEFLAVAATDGQSGDARIFLAAPLARADIERRFAASIAEVEHVHWDARAEAVTQRRQRRFGALVLEERKLENAEPARVAAAMAEGVRALGLDCLPWTDGARNLRARVAFLRRTFPEDPWPDLGDGALAATLEEWLVPYLAGMSRRAHLARLDLAAVLGDGIARALRSRMAALAPERCTLPTGASHAIDYACERGPTVRVRLQEVFGMASTPVIAGGRASLTLELLSPARRPVAVTSDLASFWTNSYIQVRGEMRGRYPKHSWPENPLLAMPLRPRGRT